MRDKTNLTLIHDFFNFCVDDINCMFMKIYKLNLNGIDFKFQKFQNIKQELEATGSGFLVLI